MPNIWRSLLMFMVPNIIAWEIKDVAGVASSIAERQYLPCMSILHPDDATWLSVRAVINLTKTLNADKSYIFSMQVASFSQDGSFPKWRDCSQVLTILLLWFPGGKQDLAKFVEQAPTEDPIWLLFVPPNTTLEAFIGDTFLPYQARTLLAQEKDEEVVITEAWKVWWTYPLRLSKYATWKPEKGLMCRTPRCPFHPRTDLEGLPFRASTKDDMPISKITRDNLGNFQIGGFFGKMYYEIIQQLNSTAVIVESVDNVTGSELFGTWNGLIGQLVRNETDFAVGPMTFHPRVSDVVDFLRPIIRTHYQVFFKQAGTVIEWNAFLKPFGAFVWRSILLWFIVGAFTFNFLYRTGCRNSYENIIYAREFNKINSFLTFFKAFCQQGSHFMPQSTSCRALYLTGYLTSSILLTAYSASLISNLTLQTPLRPFDSLETFLADGSYRLKAIARSTDYTYFSEAADDLRKSIYKKMMAMIPEDELPNGKELGLREVCEQHKKALFITFSVTQIAAKEVEKDGNCRILYFGTPIGTVFLTIGLRKGMPYNRIIHNQVQIMNERGVIRRLHKAEWPLHQTQGPEVITPQVEIRQVVQTYAVLFMGMIIAWLILAAEIITKNPKVSKKLRFLRARTGWTGETVFSFLLVVIAIICTSTIVANLMENI